MRRLLIGMVVACVAAGMAVACGPPATGPTQTPGGGGGGGVQQPPPIPNTPPQIKSITVSDTRVEVGTPLTITAVAEDAETPVANLEYRWSADTGTFSGKTAVVTWTPGNDAKTPADYVITLTLVETFTSGTATLENKVTSTTTAHVNNSNRELAEMSVRFLNDFANSAVSADKCLGEFDETVPTCKRGKADELNDISMNRHDLQIVASQIRPTSVSIGAGRTTATVHTFCAFTSKVITTQPQNCLGCKLGDVGSTAGDCFTSNVYVAGRWWLCESHYNSTSNSATVLERALEGALFGIRRSDLR
jgi:hypothetical protein